MKRIITLGAVVLLAGLSLCSKKPGNEAIVKIDGMAISQSSFDNFRKLRKMYPTQMNASFPGSRSDITFMVETNLLYRKAPYAARKVLQSGDWKLKQKFFPAQLYLSEMLDKNLGFSESEIASYFSANKQLFKGTVQVRDTVRKADITKNITDSVATRDSLIDKPLAEVRNDVIERMFYDQNPPDTAFVNKSKNDKGEIDTAFMRRSWVYQIRSKLPDFFLKRLYKKQYGSELPEQLAGIYGKGKPVSEDQMNVILAWIPEEQRQSYASDTSRLYYLAQWILKWEFFAKEAKRTGYAQSKDVAELVNWAKKYQVAAQYVSGSLLPQSSKGIIVDTTMVLFSWYDDMGVVPVAKDTASINRAAVKAHESLLSEALGGKIYTIRRQHKIEFLQADWKDDLVRNPAAIVVAADSARDSGNSAVAEMNYRLLTQTFPFTPQGQSSFSELAKIQTESGAYTDAIRNYRHVLLTSTDATKRCNTFFMIGFIYDEYLDRAEMAEANYKWVLKNTPECDLADDAEFMVQHLDEPMTSVEELRDEAMRQGRKIDDDTTAIEN